MYHLNARRRSRYPTLRAGGLLLALALGGAGAAEPQPAAAPAAAPLSVGVIGASVSAGLPMKIGMANVIATGLDARVIDGATAQFFLAPREHGATAVKLMRDHQPTFVVGVDFLFWFVYGNRPARQRLEYLQHGFRLLEQLDCPVYVGDVPAVAPSLILPANAVPPPADLALFNGFIYAWARKHPRIHVLPVADWATAIREGKTITLDAQPHTLRPADMYQLDGLHLSLKGLTYLTALVLETLAQTEPGITPHRRQRDPEAVLKQLTQAATDVPDPPPVPPPAAEPRR